jgi:2-polyprenyl-3-methyl-5-hydroxy-6-metoxy-1,4-benzoquinol methylase
MTEPTKTRPCPLCGARHFRPFHLLRDGTLEIDYVICNQCGFVFHSHPFSSKEQSEYYSHQYRKGDIKNGTPADRVLSTEQVRARLVGNFLERHAIPNVKSALDIGSSTGSLLKQMQTQLKSKVVGVEPGETYRKFAQKSNLEIYPSMEIMERKIDTKFDLITMMHVLEHLDNPLEFLKTLRSKWLTSNGSLLVEVPNTYSHDSFEFAHNSAFTPHTLREMLKLAGYKVVVFEKHGRPRSKVFPLYMTMLVHPRGEKKAKSSVRPEHFVVAKRNIGMAWRRLIQKLVPTLAWQTPDTTD